MDTPLFLSAPSKKADSINGLEASTINNKAKELLDGIHDDAEGKESWGSKFSGHDFRHAVASHLRDAGFGMDRIAITCRLPKSLSGHFIRFQWFVIGTSRTSA